MKKCSTNGCLLQTKLHLTDSKLDFIFLSINTISLYLQNQFILQYMNIWNQTSNNL